MLFIRISNDFSMVIGFVPSQEVGINKVEKMVTHLAFDVHQIYKTLDI